MAILNQTLSHARAILKDGEAWGQGFFALKANDVPCSPYSEEACKFCGLGAVRRAIWELEGVKVSFGDSRFEEALRALNSAVVRKFPGHWEFIGLNDTPETDAAAVLAVFDDAIAHAE
jgi:hypothetical protein